MTAGKIIVFNRLWVNGMALFPFILIKRHSDSENQILINHERIHLRQQLELLILPFYFIYIFCFLFNLMRYHNKRKAYLNIPFEREAFKNDSNLNYLTQRKSFAFFNYI